MSLLTGPWNLSDLREGKVGFTKHGMRVFSCFHCGGGSSMGYKLAGYDVLGGVEIDPQMMSIYRDNIRPDAKFSFLMPVQDFNMITDDQIPKELFSLDVLDGSPPCSSFSMAGSREDAWGKEKKFREGQAVQILDDLFFHFIKVAKHLQPKVVIAENVKGMLHGHAKGYVKMVFDQLREAGYETQLFLLNASRMGVPQTRERTFFIARRRDLNLPPITFQFDEPVVSASKAIGIVPDSKAVLETKSALPLWKNTAPGGQLSGAHAKGSYFNWSRLHPDRPSPTIAANCRIMHWAKPRLLEHNEIIRLQSFPDDYDFKGLHSAYVCGMSVPPFMMQRVSWEVYKQLLSKRKTIRVKKGVHAASNTAI